MPELSPSLLTSPKSQKGGLGTTTRLLTRQPFPKQPHFLISPALQQLLPLNREHGSKKCPADPSCLTSNKALQKIMLRKPCHCASHKKRNATSHKE